MLKHFEEVAATSEEFLQLSVEELAKIIESDQINVGKEKKVFETIFWWISYAPEEHSRHISLLLSNVRLALMSPEYLLDNVADNKLVKVYICGGFNGAEILSTAECYNPQTNQWTLIASMGSRRSGIGVITYADQIFAVGGFNGTTRLCTHEAYNPNTKTWHTVPSMLSPRSNFGIEVIKDRLSVVGEAGEWADVCHMEISRSALCCCVVYGLPDIAEYAAPHYTLQFSNEEEEED